MAAKKAKKSHWTKAEADEMFRRIAEEPPDVPTAAAARKTKKTGKAKKTASKEVAHGMSPIEVKSIESTMRRLKKTQTEEAAETVALKVYGMISADGFEVNPTDVAIELIRMALCTSLDEGMNTPGMTYLGQRLTILDTERALVKCLADLVHD